MGNKKHGCVYIKGAQGKSLVAQNIKTQYRRLQVSLCCSIFSYFTLGLRRAVESHFQTDTNYPGDTVREPRQTGTHCQQKSEAQWEQKEFQSTNASRNKLTLEITCLDRFVCLRVSPISLSSDVYTSSFTLWILHSICLPFVLLNIYMQELLSAFAFAWVFVENLLSILDKPVFTYLIDPLWFTAVTGRCHVNII